MHGLMLNFTVLMDAYFILLYKTKKKYIYITKIMFTSQEDENAN